jgi:hypothetical protein
MQFLNLLVRIVHCRPAACRQAGESFIWVATTETLALAKQTVVQNPASSDFAFLIVDAATGGKDYYRTVRKTTATDEFFAGLAGLFGHPVRSVPLYQTAGSDTLVRRPYSFANPSDERRHQRLR